MICNLAVNSTLFLVPRHSEGFPPSVVVSRGWHSAAHPWSQIEIELHLALGELHGHEVLLQRQVEECLRWRADILNIITNNPWLAGHEPYLPWLNTWAGLQRRRCGTWRPRWRRLGSTWWVVPLLHSPRRPGGPSLHHQIAAGWRANTKFNFQVLWLTAML